MFAGSEPTRIYDPADPENVARRLTVPRPRSDLDRQRLAVRIAGGHRMQETRPARLHHEIPQRNNAGIGRDEQRVVPCERPRHRHLHLLTLATARWIAAWSAAPLEVQPIGSRQEPSAGTRFAHGACRAHPMAASAAA